MTESAEKKILLSAKDVEVKFKVRGRILTAIRGISLDIYENESIAIVGESGSGKSVFTKTFAGMLDQNGFISNGSIVFDDRELADTKVAVGFLGKAIISLTHKRLNSYSRREKGADIYKHILEVEKAEEIRRTLSEEEQKKIDEKLDDLKFRMTEASNLCQTFDRKTEQDKIEQTKTKIKKYALEIKNVEKQRKDLITAHRASALADTERLGAYKTKIASLKADYAAAIGGEVSDEIKKRNRLIAKEIYLSVGRYSLFKRIKSINSLTRAFKKAIIFGEDVSKGEVRDQVFSNIVLRVNFTDEYKNEKKQDVLHGSCVLDLAKIKYPADWLQIRGSRIATVFQDPMTSLNPIITIGKQLTSTIIKHQKCSETQAREKALKIMQQVGIPNADKRFDDFPFQYSGGMRQRIVIAIALSCRPKILICDEPTTALDVTIQAQILDLIKRLQKEYGYTIVFITHDLGVVANVADRVAVLYAGQLVELGKVEEVFYDPRHPYTWALLSSLPQLAEKNVKLYSITGTPPSLYNKIPADAFAPRNPYCLKVDTLVEPPMFKVTDTHYAKTWLLDSRAPKYEKPEAIRDIHEKLMKTFNI
ncbi:MAG: ATP-binding cassette domain-containing protein [Clostridia bacterium]|nr:ATP-binding cassette domain-containing protein [Clostridia bacterium]